MLAAATNGKITILPATNSAAKFRNIRAEQLATATLGEYDIVIPDGETVDLTRDGRDAIYGFSVWNPTGSVAGKINARGRITPGRNKVVSPS